MTLIILVIMQQWFDQRLLIEAHLDLCLMSSKSDIMMPAGNDAILMPAVNDNGNHAHSQCACACDVYAFGVCAFGIRAFNIRAFDVHVHPPLCNMSSIVCMHCITSFGWHLADKISAPFASPFAFLAWQGLHHRDHGCPPHQELQPLGPLHLEGTCMQARSHT